MIGRAAVAASVAADAIVFYTLAEWLAAAYMGDARRAMAAWSFLLLALAAFGIPRLLGWYGVQGRTAYGVTIILALLLMYALVRWEVGGDLRLWDLAWMFDFLSDRSRSATDSGRAVFAALLLTGMWLRVSYRVSDDIEMEMIPRSVGWGFIVVTALVVIGAASDRSGEVARAGALFYVLAVIALACSQLALSGVTMGEGQAGSVVSMLFGGTLVATLAGLVVFGLLFGILGPVLGPLIGAVVEGVLTVLLTPIAWLLTKLFEALFHGANPFPNVGDAALNQARHANEGGADSKDAWQRWMTYLLRAVALAVILSTAAVAVAVFTRFRRRTGIRSEVDAHMSIVGSVGDDFREFFRSLFPRRPSRPVAFASTEATRLYLEVLDQAERDGAARAVGETAAEFQPTLASRYRTDVTEDITRAFEQARYAGREPDARMVEELRRRWRTVR